MMDTFEKVFAGAVGLVVVVFILFVWVSVMVWPEYRDEHQCKPTGNTRTVTTMTTVMAGKVPVITPVRSTSEEWACDNGSIWR